jgi:phosphate-selective porin OprO/OprP
MNQNFVTGIQFLEQFLNNRATFTSAIFRQDTNSSSGVQFGDGQWGAQGRLTALPLWDADGRHYLHVGLSGGWRNGTNNITGANGATAESSRTFELRARQELRDDDPASSPAGTQVTPDADDTRMIDTGTIVARQQFLVGSELLYVRGPFSIQAEYGANFIDDATGIGAAGTTVVTRLASPTNYVFSGGYVQLAYTLTGESRAYDQRIGTLSRYYYGDKGPFTNAWFVRDENGKLNWGLGAWEIAMRYSYVNLNDGTGASRINGGELSGFSFGLNWYLNKNMNVMFDLISDRRFDVPAATAPGVINGFGVRTTIQF